jgi:acetylornithine deacetylase/succinyl-diaminopimelate desuccinylase family protein
MDAALLPLLKDLIALPSVNPSFGGSGEAAVADYVEAFLRKAGLKPIRQEVFPGRHNVVVQIGGEGQAVLLEAHMDTVAVEGWHSGSPFDPVEKAGRVYGRGACDTKASLAVFLATAAHFADHPDHLARPLLFAATVDEEECQRGAFRLMETQPDLAGAITGEPTLLDIVHAHKGVMRIQARTTGVAAHAAFPQRGDNAILHMGDVLQRLRQYGLDLGGRSPHPSLGHPTINAGTIRGGQAVNVVPDSCIIDLDRRMLPAETEASVVGELQQLLAGLDRAALEPPYLVRTGIETSPDHPFAARLAAAVRKEKGECSFLVAPYMTNATAYAAAGVPSLVFGPGDIAQAHTKDESVAIAQLDAAFRVLVNFLRAN